VRAVQTARLISPLEKPGQPVVPASVAPVDHDEDNIPNDEIVGLTSQSVGVIRPYSAELAVAAKLADATWITLAFQAALSFTGAPWYATYVLLVCAACAGFFTLGEMASLYRSWRGASLLQEATRTGMVWVATLSVLLLAGLAVNPYTEPTRLLVFTWSIAAPAALVTWRVVLRLFLRSARARGRNTRRAAIVGACPSADRLARTLRNAPWMGLQLLGLYAEPEAPAVAATPSGTTETPGHAPQPFGERPKGDLDALVELARTGRVDEVYLAQEAFSRSEFDAILVKLADTRARTLIVPDPITVRLKDSRWQTVADQPVAGLFDTPFRGVDGWLKRVFDLCVTTLIAVAIAPLLAAIALVIRLTSKGPVLFRQRRYGLDGQVITILKFRTMTTTDDGERIEQAQRDDPRVTRVGHLLRRTSFDELPQLLNVLRGEMSLVGPRPHAVAHNELYRRLVPGYMLRHRVKPGITGLAQIRGQRGATPTVEAMRLRVESDVEYILRWSIWLDLKILLLTVRVPFDRNAY